MAMSEERFWHLIATTVHSSADGSIEASALVQALSGLPVSEILLFGERWSGLNVPRHLIHFRAEDIEDLLKVTGFEVRRRKFFSLRDNPAGLASTLCPQLEPVARHARHPNEAPAARLLKDVLYLGLVAASTPLALLEAAGAAGSTVMIEAIRKG